jgi:hypothetical protein
MVIWEEGRGGLRQFDVNDQTPPEALPRLVVRAILPG